jgi:hypothetical protein
MHFGFRSFGLDLGPLSSLLFFLDGVFPNVSGAGLNIMDMVCRCNQGFSDFKFNGSQDEL